MRSIKKKVLEAMQEGINRKNKKRLHPIQHRTIIANNCIGGYIYHWLNLRFESPTINLFILPSDYIKMLTEFDKYFDPNAEITKADSDKPYPVADIYGCKIYFMHYTDFESAVHKWRERCARINKNSLYVFMTDRDGCTVEDVKTFDNLPYKNKVIFCNREYPEVHSVFYVRGFENCDSVGQLQESMNLTGKRYIDQFDYVSFLNNK